MCLSSEEIFIVSMLIFIFAYIVATAAYQLGKDEAYREMED